MRDKIILHIDFDSFFASVEQQYHPEFRGKPLGVTATNGRTCIIASSREAKKLGIGTGTNTYKAKSICPNINLVPADFVKYWEVSKKFIMICKDYSPFVEVFSIDELFMDISQTEMLFGGTPALIARIKERIRQEIGEYITVSVGISYNKLLAKLGSGFHKPNGITKIGKEDLDEIYKQAKLSDICGIGTRIEERLHGMGIYTLLRLRKVSLSFLCSEFGPLEGMFLKQVGLGIDSRPVVPYTDTVGVKSVSRQYCLPENEYDERIVLQNVYELCEEIGIKLRRLGKKAKRIGIFLHGRQTSGGHRTLPYFIDSGKELFDTCYNLLQLPKSGFYILPSELRYTRRIAVWAGYLENRENIPESLFSDTKKRQILTEVMDKINSKFGDHTIRNGFLLYANKLTTVPNGWMADKVERMKLRNFGP